MPIVIKSEVKEGIVALFLKGKTITFITKELNIGRSFCSRTIRNNGYNSADNLVRNTHETFLQRVNRRHESGCWVWLGGTNNKGYGYVRINGALQFTHRYAYQFYKGEIGGQQVLHKCDNTICCNPDHMFLGDASANMRDREIKRRNPATKLTPDQVMLIRERVSNGCYAKTLSAEYNVSKSTIQSAASGETFKWV